MPICSQCRLFAVAPPSVIAAFAGARADLDRGDYEDVDEADLEAWLDRLADPAGS